jgi:hypothetical protein
MFVWNSAFSGYELTIMSVPAPPDVTLAFLNCNGLIGNTRIKTIARVLDWCRNEMQHFSGSSNTSTMIAHWGYAGYPPVSRVIQGTTSTIHPELGVQHWTAGCGGTTNFLINIFRSVNIPVDVTNADGHVTAHFTTDDLYLSHGDDPYDMYSKCTPPFDAELLLIDRATFDGRFGSAIPVATAANNVGYKPAELSVAYLSDYLLHLHYQDKEAGLTPQNSHLYAQLQRYYPDFNALYPQLWDRMDQKLATFGQLHVRRIF